MRTLLLALLVTCCFSISLLSCSRNELIEPLPKPGTSFELMAWDYATNYFFVDTSYLRLYEPFFQNSAPIITSPEKRIVDIEVWISRNPIYPPPVAGATAGVGHAILPETGGRYDSSFRHAGSIEGQIEYDEFCRLNARDVDLIGDGYLGLVALRFPFLDGQALAVAYRTADGRQVGEFTTSFSPADSNVRRVFKLIRCRNLARIGPFYEIPWKLMLKSVYRIGVTDVSKRDFSFEVHCRNPGTDEGTLLGHNMLRVLGLD